MLTYLSEIIIGEIWVYISSVFHEKPTFHGVWSYFDNISKTIHHKMLAFHEKKKIFIDKFHQ